MLNSPAFGLTKTLPGVAYSDALPRVRDALAAHGFGVLTEIDMKATMKKKLGKDMPSYMILGACNPPAAWDALQAEPAIGLLLPCNVVVTEDADGNAVVGAISPNAMFGVVGAEGVEPLADQVRDMLQDALDSLG